MINRFTLLFFCVFGFCCCNSKKNIQQTTDTTNTRDMDNQAAFEVSAHTKLFQSELKKVTANANIESLPDEFVKKYNLQKMEGRYFVQGFIQANEDLKAQSLTELGIKSGPSAGKMQTVNIPLHQFDQFLGLNGINYFQLSESLNPKK